MGWFCNECVLILGREGAAAAVQQVQDMISIPDDQRTIVYYIINQKYQSNRDLSLKYDELQNEPELNISEEKKSNIIAEEKKSLGACKKYVKQRCRPEIAK